MLPSDELLDIPSTSLARADICFAVGTRSIPASASTSKRAGVGLNTHPDDFYFNWPHPITDAEVYHGIFLRNFDPAEELGCFMATRGHLLQDRGHMLDAIVAYSHAHRLSPFDPSCMGFLLNALNREVDLRRDFKIPSSYRQAENFKPELYASTARFVIDERYILRAAGAVPVRGNGAAHSK